MQIKTRIEKTVHLEIVMNEEETDILRWILRHAAARGVWTQRGADVITTIQAAISGEEKEDEEKPVDPFDAFDRDNLGTGPDIPTTSKGKVDKPHSCACGAISYDPATATATDAATSDFINRLSTLRRVCTSGRSDQEPEDFDRAAQRSAKLEWNKGDRRVRGDAGGPSEMETAV